MLTRRRITPEHMDDPAIARATLSQGLRYIRFVNRRLGGTRALLAPLTQWTKAWPAHETLRIIDIGTGSADIPLAIVQWAKDRDIDVAITAVDLHATTIALAREHVGDTPQITLLQVDARRLMDHFGPNAFHIAHAGMFLHHLGDIEIMTVLRIMQRLSSIGLVWNDLVRGAIERGAIGLLTLGQPDMVKHDARVSVDAGFTRREALDIAQRLELPQPRYQRHMFGRFTLTSRRPEACGAGQ